MRVSEHFYSVQGEGKSAGVPAIFLRLGGCNLLCGGQGTHFDKELHDGAEWRCDTIEAWMKSEKISASELLTLFNAQYSGTLRSGAHLVVTGGEPLLQQKELTRFLLALEEDVVQSVVTTEVETNGTILPSVDFEKCVSQYNVSPKLTNSGMPPEKRINYSALEYFAINAKTTWKFVISDVTDTSEIYKDFISPLQIPAKKIWLMPACNDLNQFRANSAITVELCKEYGFNYSPRLQIAIWNMTTGV